jgi:hypothetical protein
VAFIVGKQRAPTGVAVSMVGTVVDSPAGMAAGGTAVALAVGMKPEGVVGSVAGTVTGTEPID